MYKPVHVTAQITKSQYEKLKALSQETDEPGNISFVIRLLIDATDQLPGMNQEPPLWQQMGYDEESVRQSDYE